MTTDLDAKALEAAGFALRASMHPEFGVTYDIEAAVRAYLEALPPTEGAGVRVKGMDWRGSNYADTPFGEYTVDMDEADDMAATPWVAWSPADDGTNIGHFATVGEAEAACEADYTARIMSSLNISEVEPAAFERELQLGIINRLVTLTVGTCSCDTKSPELKYHSETCRYRIASEALELARPLYASPTTSPQAPEGVRDDAFEEALGARVAAALLALEGERDEAIKDVFRMASAELTAVRSREAAEAELAKVREERDEANKLVNRYAWERDKAREERDAAERNAEAFWKPQLERARAALSGSTV